MNEKHWQDLLKRLKIEYGLALRPVATKDLDAFEKKRGIKLPRSYRTFCTVFGVGDFGGDEQFSIAVPGYKGNARIYSLEYYDQICHELEYQEYSQNPEQHKRGLFFASDIVRSYHFFDPAEVTDSKNNEYAVYTLFSDFQVRRTADNFWLFVTECCLGDKHEQLVKDMPPKQAFRPVTT